MTEWKLTLGDPHSSLVILRPGTNDLILSEKGRSKT
jgi:hypothetical protein